MKTAFAARNSQNDTKILTNELSQLVFMVKFYYHLLNFSLGTTVGLVARYSRFRMSRVLLLQLIDFKRRNVDVSAAS